MGISFRKEIGKIITAKNYIGVITFDDGTAIEILPRIVSNTQKSNQKSKTCDRHDQITHEYLI